MSRNGVRYAALILFCVVALQSAEVVFGQGVFFDHDLRHHHYPWRFWATEAFGRGEIPMWSPEVGNGFPLMADGQTGVFYPLNWLFGVLLPAHWALSWSLLFHQWWAGLGMFLLVRDLRADRQSSFEVSLFAGLAFSLCGFVVSHFTYAGMMQVAAWYGWALWSLLYLSRAPSVRWSLAWAGCVAALMTAGHPQVGAVGLLACGVFFVSQKPVLWAWAFVVLGGILGLSAAAPQLLASLELASQSARSGGVGVEFASMGALPPQELINIALPHFWGWEPPASLDLTYVHKGLGYFGTGENHWESCFYLGMPVVLLAGCAFFLSGHRVWKVLSIGALLLALGGLTPLYGLLRLLPGFDFFRFPARFSLVATVAMIVLAAMALERLMEAEAQSSRKRLSWVIRGLVLLGVIGLTAVGALLSSGREDFIEGASKASGDPARAEQFVDGVLGSLDIFATPNLLAMLLAANVVLLLSLRTGGTSGTRVSRAFVLLLLVDLSLFGMNYNPSTPAAEVTRKPAAESLLAEMKDNSLKRTAVVDRVQSPSLDYALMSASLGLVWGAREVAILSPLALPRNEDLLAAAGLDVGMDHGPQKVLDLLTHLQLADLMGVGLLSSVHPLPHPQLEERHRSDGVYFYENKGALPRAFAVGCVTSVSSSAEALSNMKDRNFEPAKTAFVEGKVDASCENFEGTVDVVDYAAHRVSLKAQMGASGLLVLTDSWYPGWKVTVNGVSAPILRTNSTFRGVALGAGESEVVFVYSPSWGWSVWLSLVAWASVFLGLLFFGWRSLRSRSM